MGSNALKLYSGKIFAALLALTAGASTMMANNLTVVQTGAVTCNTYTGPGTAATLKVTYSGGAIGTNTVAVTFTPPGAGLIVTAPAVTTISTANANATATTGLTYSVNAAPGCAGTAAVVFPSSLGVAVQFFDNTVADASVTVTNAITVSGGLYGGTALVASNITVVCGYKLSTPYTVGPPVTVSVSSAANQGTPFTIDESVGKAPPATLIVTPVTGGTASTSSVPFTVQAVGTGCVGVGGTSTTATVYLANAPAPDLAITVTITVLPQTPLLFTPAAPSLTYTKLSGVAGTEPVTLSTAGASVFFSVGALPIWLNVNNFTGNTNATVTFSSTTICDTLAPGNYSAVIYVNVSNYAPLPIPITLQINNKAPTLSIETTPTGSTTRNVTWVQGTATPTYYVTAVSTDSPIAYTVSTGGTLQPIIAATEQAGLAYSYGTSIPVNFNSLIFAAANPGSILTGTVTLTWGNNPVTLTVVTFNVTIQSPGATLTGISPASISTAVAPASFNVILIGSGFVIGTDPTLRTKVGVVTSGSNVVTVDSNIAVNVPNSNSTNLAITITVPVGTDGNLPFAAGGPVTIGVCTPSGGTCTNATGTQILNIGSGPILQAITSASSYIQVTSPALPQVAPYDMLSLFGANFCPVCAYPNPTVLYGAPDSNLHYASYVSPDAAGPTQRLIQVAFVSTAPTPVTTYAPVLFASNSQINVIVPGGLTVGTLMAPVQYNVVVSFGYGLSTAATQKLSATFPINIVATDPGIFTIASDGQGDAAALASGTWALISSANPAGMRNVGADSDVVQLFVTGLGAPVTGIADGTTGGTHLWDGNCITPASYLTALSNSFSPAATALLTIDGTILQSALITPGLLPPCINSALSTNPVLPIVTVGGQPTTVQYAGFVADSVPGLYQVNFLLPSSTAPSAPGTFTTTAGTTVATLTAPTQLPVVLTTNALTSQPTGVNMWFAPRLYVTPPLGTGLAGTVGVQWISVDSPGTNMSSVTAAQGQTPYSFAVTSGSLPAGVTLDPVLGALTGIPAANSAGNGYLGIVVTAKDSNVPPLTGTTSFNLTVAGGLVISGTAPGADVFGTLDASEFSATAAGGLSPYTYSITSPVGVATMTITSTAGVSPGLFGITALTPAGTYPVTIHAHDSTAGTALVGNVSFPLVISLDMAYSGPASVDHTAGGPVTTVTATGQTGIVRYDLDAVTNALGYVTIDHSTGIVSVTGGIVPGVSSVTATVTATDNTTATGSTAAATGTTTSFTIATT